MNIQTVTLNNISFVNATKPGELDIKYVKNNFGFSPLHLEDYINKTQVPKIETMKDYTLVVLDFPFFPQDSPPTTTRTDEKTQKSTIETILTPLPSMSLPSFGGDKKKRILASQIDIFIGKDYVVVMHESTLLPINDIFSHCQRTLHSRKEFMGEGPVFLAYRIIDALVDACFPVMNEIASSIDKIDKDLEENPSPNTLEQISVTRRNIVVFQTMIKPILPIFRQVEEGIYKQLNGSMQQFWGNVVDHLQKIWDRLEDSRELVEGISESNESLINSRTNEIIKVLTIFSAVMLPLNLIASVYGMNIHDLPFVKGDIPAFWLILIFMFVLASIMLITFKSRRWF